MIAMGEEGGGSNALRNCYQKFLFVPAKARCEKVNMASLQYSTKAQGPVLMLRHILRFQQNVKSDFSSFHAKHGTRAEERY